MKSIIVCCDGTWNRPGTKEKNKRVYTNVEILYRCIPPQDVQGINQVKFYESGVGSSTFDLIDIVFGGLKGSGIDKRILDVYSFIAINYEKGDHIYIFGFSRGAYTARSVAGLIRNCGLLKPKNINLAELAYDHYRNRNEYAAPDSDYMQSFRKKFCIEQETFIKCIGVWDTVGALGLPLPFLKFFNQEKYKFHDLKLSSYVENAFHAIAIDEHRKLFKPTLWEIGKPRNPDFQFEQCWFSGSHSNVGGGYGNTCLSDIALDWMVEKVTFCGLLINDIKVQEFEDYRYSRDPNGPIINSRRKYYRLWRMFHRVLLENTRMKSTYLTNEKVHETVDKRYEVKLKLPKNYKEYLDLYTDN
jgi:uncharacterized protein (DUF2235 family)